MSAIFDVVSNCHFRHVVKRIHVQTAKTPFAIKLSFPYNLSIKAHRKKKNAQCSNDQVHMHIHAQKHSKFMGVFEVYLMAKIQRKLSPNRVETDYRFEISRVKNDAVDLRIM